MSAKLSWHTTCILIFTFAFSSIAENRATFEDSVQRYRTRINKDPENLDLHREMIDYAVKSQQIDVPLHIYQNAHAKKPDSPLFCYVLAYTYFKSKQKIEQAVDLLQTAISSESQFWEAYRALGKCYLLQEETGLAMNAFYQSVQIQPKAWQVQIQLAELYREQHNEQQALHHYQQAATVQPRSADIHFEIGLLARRLNDFQTAEAAFLKAIRFDNNSPDAYYQLGQIYALQQKPGKATDQYRRARKIDINPRPVPRYQLADIFLELEDGRSAILALRSGLSLDSKYVVYTDRFKNVSTPQAAQILSEMLTTIPSTTDSDSDAFLHYFAGKLHLKIDDSETARRHLEQVVTLKPDHAQAHVLLGRLYEKSEPEAAIEAFEQSVELGNNEVEVMVKLAENYQQEKNYNKFTEIADKILTLAKHPEIHYQLALYHEDQAFLKRQAQDNGTAEELEDKALYHADQAVKIAPEVAKYNLKLGTYYDRRGQLKAIRFYEKAIELDPQNPEGYYKRGLFMSNYTFGADKVLLYAPEDVMADLQKAIELDPNSAGAHRALGIVYDRMYDTANAIKTFKKAVRLDPNDAYSQIYLAEQYAQTGQQQLAINALAKAIEARPADVEALKDYAFLCLNHDQERLWKEAKRSLEMAIQIRPNDAEILMNYGYTLYLNGETDLAIKHYQKSIQLKPDWDITHYNLGLAYERIRKYNLAKQSFQKVTQINPNSTLSDKSIDRLVALERK